MPRDVDNNIVYVRARVPKDIHLQFKIAALKAGKDMDKIINELILCWLKERGDQLDHY
ncbi:MAG: plasmid partition protein ParG [Rhizonema sp. NSF051]|nr:plasmid partition protein ParG [Rhizonema sp. NSF051]